MMKARKTLVFASTGVTVTTVGVFSGTLEASFASGVEQPLSLIAQQSSPPQAPSFFKQAGQKIFDSAQKGVLHELNQKLRARRRN